MTVVTFWQPAVVCFNWFIYCLVCDMANKILSHLVTSRCAARWPLPDNYRQVSQKRSIYDGEMYSTTCVELAVDHFGRAILS